jgi:hypothetical protein
VVAWLKLNSGKTIAGLQRCARDGSAGDCGSQLRKVVGVARVRLRESMVRKGVHCEMCHDYDFPIVIPTPISGSQGLL